MTPQPLSALLHTVPSQGIKLFDFTVEAIDRQPDLAAMAMRVIATWSSIDAQMIRLASGLLRSDPELVAQMLVALTSVDARRAAVKALAETALRGDQHGLALFMAVTKAIGPSRARRNEFAHWLWAYWSPFPDALLLFPVRHTAIRDAQLETKLAARATWIAAGKRGPEPLLPAELYDGEEIMVFRKLDFDRDLRDARKAAELVEKLLSALLGSESLSAQARSELQTEPAIVQALTPQSSVT